MPTMNKYECAIAAFSIGNGKIAVVVSGEDYKVFDTPAEARQYIQSVLERTPQVGNDPAPSSRISRHSPD